MDETTTLVHYVPVATTVLSALFCAVLLRRYRFKRRGTHLVWWAFGILCYGIGTALEGSITLFGNSIALTKAWYIAGACLGGYPLAQGTVYLLLRRRTAHILTAISLPFIVFVSILVLASPVDSGAMMPNKPGGEILGWHWVRLLTIPINSYAGLFLIGGAVLSAWRFSKHRETKHRAVGNALIAAGALMPAIGGGMAKWGIVEGLYLGEFIGLILIWMGYRWCVFRSDRSRAPSAASEPRVAVDCGVQA